MTSRLRYVLYPGMLGCLALASTASAQLDPELMGGDPLPELEELEPAGPTQPARVIVSLTGGAALRLVKNDVFLHTRLAPAFIDAFGAFVFPTSSSWRHGVGLGLSTNIRDDGPQVAPDDERISGFEQYVVSVAYVGYLKLSDDFVFMAKAAPSLTFAPDLAPGLDLTGGLAFMLTSGLGLYAELGLATFLGSPETPSSGQTLHPLITAEVGLIIDYELLP